MNKTNLKVKSGQAARSTQITVVNGLANCSLKLASSNLEHGEWNGGPVKDVGAETIRVVGQNESDGFMTGAQGSITYDVYLNDKKSNHSIVIAWDNPYVGSNSYSFNVYESNEGVPISNIYVNYSGGSGDNTSVTFIICFAENYS